MDIFIATMLVLILAGIVALMFHARSFRIFASERFKSASANLSSNRVKFEMHSEKIVAEAESVRKLLRQVRQDFESKEEQGKDGRI